MTQGGAARLSPLRSALGYSVWPLRGGMPGASQVLRIGTAKSAVFRGAKGDHATAIDSSILPVTDCPARSGHRDVATSAIIPAGKLLNIHRMVHSRHMSTKQRSLGDVLQEFAQHRQVMQSELQKIIVGQDAVIEQLFAAIFTRGHCLLEGVPGLAKTLMVSTLAKILDVSFKRIQFTPDLMPSDITGTNVLEEDEAGRREFRFVEGPVFTNILLADEINRTPPKTQAALLQAMQERQVTVGRTTYDLPDPFFTIATQNPIEQEGTYPLPEAQLDRFMFNIKVGYPTADEEEKILSVTTRNEKVEVHKVFSGARSSTSRSWSAPWRSASTSSSMWPGWCAQPGPSSRPRRSTCASWWIGEPAPARGSS